MRSLRSITLFLAALLLASATAQPSSARKTWQEVLSNERHRGEIKDLEIADNGDLLVAGFVSAAGGSDAWIARFDGSGRQLWSRQVGDRPRDQALDIALTRDGGGIMVGYSNNGIGPATVGNGFVAKFGAEGSLAWQRTFTQEPELILSQVEKLADGDVIVAGSHYTNDAPTRHPFLARLDENGSIKWQFDPDPHDRSLVRSGSIVWPWTTISISSDRVIEVQQVVGGEVVAEHLYGGCTTVDVASGSALAAPCDATIPSDIKRAHNGIAFQGGTTGAYSATDPVIRKYENSRLVWERVLTSLEIDGLNDAAATADGGVVAAGFSIVGDHIGMHNWDALLIKLDVNGDEVWRRKFGGSQRDEFTRVAILTDGSIIAAGYTGSQGQYEWAPWLLRLDALGELDADARAVLASRQR